MKVSAIILDERLTEIMPTYATEGSAGLDLRASLSGDYALPIFPNEVVHVPTGLKLHIANPDFVGLVFPRSGLSSKQGITLANCVGVIDSDYQGELIVALKNTSEKTFYLNPMERIAQFVVVPVVRIELEPVKAFIPTERGEGGFGSTGKA